MSDSEQQVPVTTPGGAPLAAEAGQKRKKDKKSKKEKREKKRHRREVPDAEEDATALEARRMGLLHSGSDDDEEEDLLDLNNITDDETSEDERGPRNQYLEDEVSEASSDEESFVVKPSERELEEERLAAERLKRHERKKNVFMEDLQDKTDEEAARELKERYRAREEAEKLRKAGVGAGGLRARLDSSQRYSAALLPRPSDPKVFAVKVRPGQARVLVARIVNKCQAYLRGENEAQVRQDLGIVSVFSVDHVREWIYLESHRQRFVETAIAGLEHVFRGKISQVDPKDLMQLMERQVVRKQDVQVGQYIRMKNGPYRGDVGLVHRVEDEGHRAVVRLVPREDFVDKAFEKRRYVRGAPKLQARLFAPRLTQGAVVDEVAGVARWGDLVFDAQGYLLKPVLARNFLSGDACPPPSLEDLVAYHGNDTDAIERAMSAMGSSSGLAVGGTKHRPAFAPDEPVRVVSGQLVGVVGRIRETSSGLNRASIETMIKDQRSLLTVNLDDLAKHFEVGTHVIVEHGPQSGESGTVIATKESLVYIVTDAGNELHVDADHCRASKLKASQPHRAGAHSLYDLVTLSDDTTVGCICALTATTVTIVTTKDTLIRTSLSNVKQTLRERMAVTDRLHNKVTDRDAVTVDANGVPHEYANLRATVRHVYQNTLFLCSTSLRRNAGMFALSAKNVVRIGGLSKHKQPSATNTGRAIIRDAHPARAAEKPTANVLSVASVMSVNTVDLDGIDF